MPSSPLQVKEEASELEKLLYKNAYTELGLIKEEHRRALKLIRNPLFSKDDCWACTIYTREKMKERISGGYAIYPVYTTKEMKERAGIRKAIYDTGLYQEHALYALATRK